MARRIRKNVKFGMWSGKPRIYSVKSDNSVYQVTEVMCKIHVVYLMIESDVIFSDITNFSCYVPRYLQNIW